MGKPDMPSQKVIQEHLDGGASVGELREQMKQEDKEREETEREYQKHEKISKVITELERELVEGTSDFLYRKYFAVNRVMSGLDNLQVIIDMTRLLVSTEEVELQKILLELKNYVRRKFEEENIDDDIRILFLGLNN